MDSSSDQTSRLLALIVHELRAPAGVVSGYLRMLAKSGVLERSVSDSQMVDDAAKTCARILRVVQEIDDLSNLDDPDQFKSLTPFPVFKLCEEVIREAAANGDAVSFRCADGDRSTMVRGESVRLKRAVSTLLAFTVRERGRLAVCVDGFVTNDDADRSVVIAFGQDGSARDVLKSQSVQFDRWRGGMGLVVPMACRIVELHGGHVWSVSATPASCALKLPLPA